MARNSEEIINYSKAVKDVLSVLNEVKTTLKEVSNDSNKAFTVPSDSIKANKELLQLNKEAVKVQQELEKQNALIEKTRQQQLVADQKDIDLKRKKLQLAEQERKAKEAQAKSEAQLIAQGKRAEEQQARTNARLQEQNRAYVQLHQKHLLAKKSLQDLLVTENASASAIAKAREEFNKLDRQILAVDKTVNDHRRNVGNYSSALVGLGSNFKSMLGAFGLFGGLTLGVSVLKDAFNIMKEFDAEMVNLGAIAGKSRSELGSLEKVIRDTAKSSLNTANDVAKVATELIKLGSSIEETEKLIPTVNSLSIALRSNADETAELLKSTLNAFGENASEAERYGDVIAGMANKSALDFGRIRDAMSYIAPVAKVLGYTIEETGALIGVLVDNGIKAESAGRLLRTGMVKLQGQGLSLNQALEKIRNSNDQVTTAMKLMGVEAGTLGVVLANNNEKFEELTKQLQNSKGELQELTDKQLESLSARINIMKSNWEEFILTIDNGNGSVAEFTRNTISAINQMISGLTRLSKSWGEIWKGAEEKGFNAGVKETENFIDKIKDQDDKRRVLNNKLVDGLTRQRDLEKEIQDLKQKEFEISTGSLWNRLTSKGVYWYQKEIEEKQVLLGQLKGVNTALQKELDPAEVEDVVTTKTNTNKGGSDLTKAQQRELDKRLAQEKKNEEERIKLKQDTALTILKTSIDLQKRELEEQSKTALQSAQIELLYARRQQEVITQEHFNALDLIKDSDANAQEKRLQQWAKYYASLEKMMNDVAKAEKKVTEERDKEITKEADKGIKRLESELKFTKKIEEEKAKAIKEQQEKTKDYLMKFNDMGNFGFDSLNIFTTFDENGKSMFENMFEHAKNWKEKTALVIGSVGEIMKDVMATMQQASKSRFENEMRQIEVEYQTNLLFAGNSAEAKEALELQMEEKQKELRKKQAKRDKEMAIMNAVINTAQGVVSMLATVPWPANLVMAGLVGALGAVQIATIASTPIPEFYTGTDNAPQGLAWTQERGAEVITDKNNKVKTMGHNKGATLTMLDKGDKVYKSREDYFNHIGSINDMLDSNGITNISYKGGTSYEEMDYLLSKYMGVQEIHTTNFDENGVSTFVEKRNVKQRKKAYNARG